MRVAAAALLAPSPTASDAWLAATVETPSPALSRPPEVWLVEERDGVEYFSNGLRVETRGAVEGRPRRYPVYDAATLELREWRAVPAGIIYHTTESHIAPFRPEQNGRLRLAGQWMLDYVRRNRSYHFVVDRFGRVHRIVAEADAASHAGASVWASGGELFVNLNTSFLGVAFETETREPARGAELYPCPDARRTPADRDAAGPLPHCRSQLRHPRPGIRCPGGHARGQPPGLVSELPV